MHNAPCSGGQYPANPVKARQRQVTRSHRYLNAEQGYDRTPKAIRDAAHEHDAKLQKAGTVMGIAGTPFQVRNPESAGVASTSGPYMNSPSPWLAFPYSKLEAWLRPLNWFLKAPALLLMASSRSGHYKIRRLSGTEQTKSSSW